MFHLKRFHRPLLAIQHRLHPQHAPFHVNNLLFSSAVNPNELLELLQTHNNERKQKAAPKPNTMHMDHLIDQIRTLHSTNPQTLSSELALNACFFITHYHTDKALALSQDNVDEFQIFQENHYQDMNIGWALLNTPSDAQNTFDPNKSMWKIEMATRLEDTLKIYTSFLELYAVNNHNFNDFQNDQLMIAFSTIPYIGQWSLMLQLGVILKTRIPNAFTSLYNMAQTLPIPDFTMIYDLVKQNEDTLLRNEPKLDDLNGVMNAYIEWNMFEFEAVRLKFSGLKCYKSMDDMSVDTDKQDVILENMQGGMMDWCDVDLNEDKENEQGCNLRKMGGICQAKSFYSYGDMIPIQLYGPWMEGRINVKGKVEVPIFNEDNKLKDGENNDEDINEDKDAKDDAPAVVIIHEEEWDLVKDVNNEKLFKGKYIVRQRNEILDKENVKPDSEQMANFGPMDWIYDLEITVN